MLYSAVHDARINSWSKEGCMRINDCGHDFKYQHRVVFFRAGVAWKCATGWCVNNCKMLCRATLLNISLNRLWNCWSRLAVILGLPLMAQNTIVTKFIHFTFIESIEPLSIVDLGFGFVGIPIYKRKAIYPYTFTQLAALLSNPYLWFSTDICRGMPYQYPDGKGEITLYKKRTYVDSPHQKALRRTQLTICA